MLLGAASGPFLGHPVNSAVGGRGDVGRPPRSERRLPSPSDITHLLGFGIDGRKLTSGDLDGVGFFFCSACPFAPLSILKNGLSIAAPRINDGFATFPHSYLNLNLILKP